MAGGAWVRNKVELDCTVIRMATPLISDVRLMLAELMEWTYKVFLSQDRAIYD